MNLYELHVTGIDNQEADLIGKMYTKQENCFVFRYDVFYVRSTLSKIARERKRGGIIMEVIGYRCGYSYVYDENGIERRKEDEPEEKDGLWSRLVGLFNRRNHE